MRSLLRFLAAALAACLLFACAVKEPVTPPPAKPAEGFVRLTRSEAAALAGGLDRSGQKLSTWLELAAPLTQSLAYLSAKPADGLALERPDLRLTWGQLRLTAERLLDILPRLDADPGLLGREFFWFELRPEPLMTGYYAPLIEGSLKPAPGYPYPLYAVPQDLKSLDLGQFQPRWSGQQLVYRLEGDKVRPYHDRRQIDGGKALAGKGLEIAWVRDAWDVYDLQVQGSGYLRLPDGRIQPVLYAGKNGRSFTGLAQPMIDRGLLARGEVNREGIRAALNRLAEKQRMELLYENQSYVFFRLSDSPPVGTIGRPLTGLVSMATDPSVLPLGAVVPFSAELPGNQGEARRQVAGLGLAQDTGGVIKGLRIDYYYGYGPDREWMAFHTKTPVRARLLLHRDAAPHLTDIQ